MASNVVSIDKSLTKEKSELFEYHYSFIENLLNYERNSKQYIKDVFDGKEEDVDIKKQIKAKHRSIIWPVLFSSLCFISLLGCVSLQMMGLFSIVIILGMLSGYLWNAYSKEENEKSAIVDHIYEKESKNAILSQGYLISLKVFADEAVMIDLLKRYGKNIPYSEATKIIAPYHRSFENYKALELYKSIR